MCHWIGQEQAEPRGAGATPPLHPSDPQRLRARWAGAGAAVLLAGLAAAMVAPSPVQAPVAPEPAAAAVAPVALRSAVPAGDVVEQTATTLDDGVPTRTDPVRAQLGHCEHGM